MLTTTCGTYLHVVSIGIVHILLDETSHSRTLVRIDASWPNKHDKVLAIVNLDIFPIGSTASVDHRHTLFIIITQVFEGVAICEAHLFSVWDQSRLMSTDISIFNTTYADWKMSAESVFNILWSKSILLFCLSCRHVVIYHQYYLTPWREANVAHWAAPIKYNGSCIFARNINANQYGNHISSQCTAYTAETRTCLVWLLSVHLNYANKCRHMKPKPGSTSSEHYLMSR